MTGKGGGSFEKVIDGVDRAHRFLLGTNANLVGIGRIVNRDGKYSDRDLRYPTFIAYTYVHRINPSMNNV